MPFSFNFLKNISIRIRLMFGFSILCLLTLLTAGGGYYAQRQLTNNMGKTTDTIILVNQNQQKITQQLGMIRRVSEAILSAKTPDSVHIENEKLHELSQNGELIGRVVEQINTQLAHHKIRQLNDENALKKLSIKMSDEFIRVNELIQSVVDSLTFEVKINTDDSSMNSMKTLNTSSEGVRQQVNQLTVATKQAISSLKSIVSMQNIVLLLELQSKDLILATKAKRIKSVRNDLNDSITSAKGLFSQHPSEQISRNLLAQLASIKTLVKKLGREKSALQTTGVNNSAKLKGLLDRLNDKFNELKGFTKTLTNSIDLEVQSSISKADDQIGTQILSSQENIKKGLESLSSTTEQSLATISQALSIKSASQEIQNQVKDLFYSSNLKKIKYAAFDIEDLIDAASDSLAMLPSGSEQVKESLLLLKEYVKNIADLKRSIIKAKALMAAMLVTSTEQENPSLFDLITKLEESILSAAADMEKTVQDALSQSRENAAMWQTSQVAFGFCSFVLALFLGVSIVRSISRPLIDLKTTMAEFIKGNFSHQFSYRAKDEIGDIAIAIRAVAKNQQKHSNLASAISNGDLTGKATISSEKDALGIALTTMTEFLEQTIENINTESQSIHSISSELSHASDSLSNGARLQAESLEQVRHQMDEVGDQTSQNANSSKIANKISNEAADSASDGTKQMDIMLQSMSEITNSSQKITEIISVINGIAEQTNLLALNAAIEAARAGESGRGFSVVADEVRSLAAKSSQAASESEKLIKGSTKNVDQGSHIATQTATKLNSIQDLIAEVTKLVYEISSASSDQSGRFSSINNELKEVNQVTNKTKEEAEKSAEIAKELAARSSNLQQLLTKFKV